MLTIPVRFIGTEGSVGVGEGSVWITARGNVLTRFNAITGAEEATIKLPGEAPAAIVDNGFVWVTGFERGELYKVDAGQTPSSRRFPSVPGHVSSPQAKAPSGFTIKAITHCSVSIRRPGR